MSISGIQIHYNNLPFCELYFNVFRYEQVKLSSIVFLHFTYLKLVLGLIFEEHI